MNQPNEPISDPKAKHWRYALWIIIVLVPIPLGPWLFGLGCALLILVILYLSQLRKRT